MLPKALLEVTKRKPHIRPVYRDVDEYRPTAEQVIEIYEAGAENGATRGTIEEQIEDLETHDTFKLVRALSRLLERLSTFEEHAPTSPRLLREAAFQRGFVTGPDERSAAITDVAAEFDITPDAVEDGLWADREEEEVLVSAPEINPDELLRRYNLSLTQTLLFDAIELEFTASENFQDIFGLLKYLGLMYRVDEDLAVTVTGPAALLKRTRKYGTTLAKLLPSIVKADDWRIEAQVETEVSGERRIYTFSLDSDEDDRFPAKRAVQSFDSAVERDFATRIDALAEGWSVVHEPTILRAGHRVMIPDFSFERQRGADGPAFYLEVIGFWTPEYLESKLQKVRTVESEVPLMLAVDTSLNCTEADFERTNVEEVIFYEDSIPVKPVFSRLKQIDDRHISADVNALSLADLNLPDDETVAIATMADRHGVEPDAIRRLLAGHGEGIISNDRYVPPNVLDQLREQIDAMEDPTVADVVPVLERAGVAVTALEDIGYNAEYTSLNQAEARVSRQG